MQVSSTSNASPANIPLSLQSSQPRSHEERTVTAVGPRTVPPEYFVPQSAPAARLPENLDSTTEKKLSRIQEVQVAFRAALHIANLIEDQYLLEPII